jgi:hypothetical protein
MFGGSLLGQKRFQQGVVPCVTAIHFAQAELMAKRWLTSTLKLIDALGQTLFQKNCDAVLRTIRGRPDGQRRRDISRKHRGLRPRELDEILSALQGREEIAVAEEKKKKGPAYQVIRPVPREG